MTSAGGLKGDGVYIISKNDIANLPTNATSIEIENLYDYDSGLVNAVMAPNGEFMTISGRRITDGQMDVVGTNYYGAGAMAAKDQYLDHTSVQVTVAAKDAGGNIIGRTICQVNVKVSGVGPELWYRSQPEATGTTESDRTVTGNRGTVRNYKASKANSYLDSVAKPTVGNEEVYFAPEYTTVGGIDYGTNVVYDNNKAAVPVNQIKVQFTDPVQTITAGVTGHHQIQVTFEKVIDPQQTYYIKVYDENGGIGWIPLYLTISNQTPADRLNGRLITGSPGPNDKGYSTGTAYQFAATTAADALNGVGSTTTLDINDLVSDGDNTLSVTRDELKVTNIMPDVNAWNYISASVSGTDAGKIIVTTKKTTVGTSPAPYIRITVSDGYESILIDFYYTVAATPVADKLTKSVFVEQAGSTKTFDADILAKDFDGSNLTIVQVYAYTANGRGLADYVRQDSTGYISYAIAPNGKTVTFTANAKSFTNSNYAAMGATAASNNAGDFGAIIRVQNEYGQYTEIPIDCEINNTAPTSRPSLSYSGAYLSGTGVFTPAELVTDPDVKALAFNIPGGAADNNVYADKLRITGIEETYLWTNGNSSTGYRYAAAAVDGNGKLVITPLRRTPGAVKLTVTVSDTDMNTYDGVTGVGTTESSVNVDIWVTVTNTAPEYPGGSAGIGSQNNPKEVILAVNNTTKPSAVTFTPYELMTDPDTAGNMTQTEANMWSMDYLRFTETYYETGNAAGYVKQLAFGVDGSWVKIEGQLRTPAGIYVTLRTRVLDRDSDGSDYYIRVYVTNSEPGLKQEYKDKIGAQLQVRPGTKPKAAEYQVTELCVDADGDLLDYEYATQIYRPGGTVLQYGYVSAVITQGTAAHGNEGHMVLRVEALKCTWGIKDIPGVALEHGITVGYVEVHFYVRDRYGSAAKEIALLVEVINSSPYQNEESANISIDGADAGTLVVDGTTAFYIMITGASVGEMPSLNNVTVEAGVTRTFSELNRNIYRVASDPDMDVIYLQKQNHTNTIGGINYEMFLPTGSNPNGYGLLNGASNGIELLASSAAGTNTATANWYMILKLTHNNRSLQMDFAVTDSAADAVDTGMAWQAQHVSIRLNVYSVDIVRTSELSVSPITVKANQLQRIDMNQIANATSVGTSVTVMTDKPNMPDGYNPAASTQALTYFELLTENSYTATAANGGKNYPAKFGEFNTVIPGAQYALIGKQRSAAVFEITVFLRVVSPTVTVENVECKIKIEVINSDISVAAVPGTSPAEYYTNLKNSEFKSNTPSATVTTLQNSSYTTIALQHNDTQDIVNINALSVIDNGVTVNGVAAGYNNLQYYNGTKNLDYRDYFDVKVGVTSLWDGSVLASPTPADDSQYMYITPKKKTVGNTDLPGGYFPLYFMIYDKYGDSCKNPTGNPSGTELTNLELMSGYIGGNSVNPADSIDGYVSRAIVELRVYIYGSAPSPRFASMSEEVYAGESKYYRLTDFITGVDLEYLAGAGIAVDKYFNMFPTSPDKSRITSVTVTPTGNAATYVEVMKWDDYLYGANSNMHSDSKAQSITFNILNKPQATDPAGRRMKFDIHIVTNATDYNGNFLECMFSITFYIRNRAPEQRTELGTNDTWKKDGVAKNIQEIEMNVGDTIAFEVKGNVVDRSSTLAYNSVTEEWSGTVSVADDNNIPAQHGTLIFPKVGKGDGYVGLEVEAGNKRFELTAKASTHNIPHDNNGGPAGGAWYKFSITVSNGDIDNAQTACVYWIRIVSRPPVVIPAYTEADGTVTPVTMGSDVEIYLEAKPSNAAAGAKEKIAKSPDKSVLTIAKEPRNSVAFTNGVTPDVYYNGASPYIVSEVLPGGTGMAYNYTGSYSQSGGVFSGKHFDIADITGGQGIIGLRITPKAVIDGNDIAESDFISSGSFGGAYVDVVRFFITDGNGNGTEAWLRIVMVSGNITVTSGGITSVPLNLPGAGTLASNSVEQRIALSGYISDRDYAALNMSYKVEVYENMGSHKLAEYAPDQTPAFVAYGGGASAGYFRVSNILESKTLYFDSLKRTVSPVLLDIKVSKRIFAVSGNNKEGVQAYVEEKTIRLAVSVRNTLPTPANTLAFGGYKGDSVSAPLNDPLRASESLFSDPDGDNLNFNWNDCRFEEDDANGNIKRYLSVVKNSVTNELTFTILGRPVGRVNESLRLNLAVTDIDTNTKVWTVVTVTFYNDPPAVEGTGVYSFEIKTDGPVEQVRLGSTGKAGVPVGLIKDRDYEDANEAYEFRGDLIAAGHGNAVRVKEAGASAELAEISTSADNKTIYLRALSTKRGAAAVPVVFQVADACGGQTLSSITFYITIGNSAAAASEPAPEVNVLGVPDGATPKTAAINVNNYFTDINGDHVHYNDLANVTMTVFTTSPIITVAQSGQAELIIRPVPGGKTGTEILEVWVYDGPLTDPKTLMSVTYITVNVALDPGSARKRGAVEIPNKRSKVIVPADVYEPEDVTGYAFRDGSLEVPVIHDAMLSVDGNSLFAKNEGLATATVILVIGDDVRRIDFDVKVTPNKRPDKLITRFSAYESQRDKDETVEGGRYEYRRYGVNEIFTDPEGDALILKSAASTKKPMAEARVEHGTNQLLIIYKARGSATIEIQVSDAVGTYKYEFEYFNDDLPALSFFQRGMITVREYKWLFIILAIVLLVLLILLIVLLAARRRKQRMRAEIEALLVNEMELEEQLLKLAAPAPSYYQSFGYLPPTGGASVTTNLRIGPAQNGLLLGQGAQQQNSNTQKPATGQNNNNNNNNNNSFGSLDDNF